MLKYLFADTSTLARSDARRLSIALLLLRLFVGISFMFHGFGKIQNPFAWMPPESGVPENLQALAALAEFGGGFAIIFGALTPLVSIGFIFTMLGAIVYHLQKGDGFFGGYETASLYLVISVLFLLVGPGRYSLDQVLRAKVRFR